MKTPSGISRKKIDELGQWVFDMRLVELTDHIADTVPDEQLIPADEQLIEAENIRLVIQEIANLPQEQSMVMVWRYNSDELKTQQQIADIMGVKRQRIGQIEEAAIAILRKRLAYSQK